MRRAADIKVSLIHYFVHEPLTLAGPDEHEIAKQHNALMESGPALVWFNHPLELIGEMPSAELEAAYRHRRRANSTTKHSANRRLR